MKIISILLALIIWAVTTLNICYCYETKVLFESPSLSSEDLLPLTSENFNLNPQEQLNSGFGSGSEDDFVVTDIFVDNFEKKQNNSTTKTNKEDSGAMQLISSDTWKNNAFKVTVNLTCLTSVTLIWTAM